MLIILCIKKKKGEIDNIISVKVNEQDILVQDAICQAKEDLLLSLKRFEQAAEALLTDTTFNASLELKQELVSIVEEFRHNVSANIDWRWVPFYDAGIGISS